MFFHLYKYRLLKLIRTKELFFWSMIFPIFLGTLFYLCLGNFMNGFESFKVIPVAVVEEKAGGEQDPFRTLLDQLSKEGEDQTLDVQYCGDEEARELLERESVTGIVYIGEDLRLMMGSSGINESILKNILDSYLEIKNTMSRIAMDRSNQLMAAAQALSQDQSFLKEIRLTNGNQSDIIQYFYALLAMTCLYGGFLGMTNGIEVQANQSDLGARRSIGPSKKSVMGICDFLAALTIQFGEILILLFYLIVILKLDFGHQIGLVLLTSLAGCIVGVAYGLFIGTVVKGKQSVKEGFMIASIMVMCFLGGLMYGNIRMLIERSFPLLNRINPAALLSDAFYSLDIYDDYSRFFQNLGTLLIFAVILCGGSFMVIRRKKYASI